ncbi:hypothetical protein G9A89_010180 [Geosiphon pyriformis]|nr:hypothetical protein G9A89_010180 [Geosiphon pyriformis]
MLLSPLPTKIPAETAYTEMEFDPEEYEDKSNNPGTAQVKSTVNKKLRFFSPTTPLYYQTPQRKYGLLFGNLSPTLNKTDENTLTWELLPTQPLTKSSTTPSKETAILQPIGKINKEKQPELAPEEHSSTQTLNPLASIKKPTNFAIFKLVFPQYFCDPNTFIRLQNQFSIIKQKDHEAVITYLEQFNQIFCQIQTIERNYYTVAQIFNQFIKGLKSTVTFAHDFESAKQETNHTQAINLAINRTSDINTKIIQLSEKLIHKIEKFLAGTVGPYQLPQQKDKSNEPKPKKSILAPKIFLKHNIPIPYVSISTTSILTTNAIYPAITSDLLPVFKANDSSSTPAPKPSPTRYPNQASYFGLTENQNFYSSTSLERKDVEETSTPLRRNQINNTILLTIITKDTTLAAIFSFNIDYLNTTSLFSGAAINQDKPIMALYTNARVENIDIKLILDSGSAGSIITKQLMDQLDYQIDHAATARIITADGNIKILIGEIDNFLFEINGIQIPIKVLVMEATQYQALIGNDWLAKAHATLDWNTQELQITFNEQHAQVPAMCKHFQVQSSKEPLIEFEDTTLPPTIEIYQVLWADDFRTELLPPPTWEEKKKGKAEEKL